MNNRVKIIVCLCLIAGMLCACGVKAGEQETDKNEKILSANEAYEAAVSATEGEACTSDECVVTLYDEDGSFPYNVMSPLGAIVK